MKVCKCLFDGRKTAWIVYDTDTEGNPWKNSRVYTDYMEVPDEDMEEVDLSAPELVTVELAHAYGVTGIFYSELHWCGRGREGNNPFGIHHVCIQEECMCETICNGWRNCPRLGKVLTPEEYEEWCRW